MLNGPTQLQLVVLTNADAVVLVPLTDRLVGRANMVWITLPGLGFSLVALMEWLLWEMVFVRV